ncbi:integral membrane protein [Clostridium sporogenes PA 3679]|uniref:TIGR01906 family membrane protein n=1 Tax=Clostridium sporogenes TaxID=1509 RepID=UPI00024BAE6F|nr:TIGR01906 family membrane protein [Clostridium sporogenes]EHN15437.1 integral membrane protein [Clostridium sporogenes PA 3679]MCW6106943.1 TIGR01906 family membrane protein [Clostridium sporogenes]MDU6334810.1 TIGR01906 family membrane protein [Clostridium sporogenes]NFQ85985.1 TIGR01906 family membrane protein [Clostridium sporogenes]NFU10561.1 TIGR01906 family membrane protein [Clostridium sporogenes]
MILKNKGFFIDILLSIILTIIFIIISVKLTLNLKILYYWDITNLSIIKNTDLNVKEIKENFNYLIYYLNSHKNITFCLPSLPSSKEGVIHFKDVKNIFNFLDKFLFINIFISVPVIYYKLKMTKNVSFLKYSSILTIIIPLSLIIPLTLNFDNGFTLFHRIFFSNDYWIFNPNKDPIINLLPEAFFFHSVLLILFFIILFSLISYILYKNMRKL